MLGMKHPVPPVWGGQPRRREANLRKAAGAGVSGLLKGMKEANPKDKPVNEERSSSSSVGENIVDNAELENNSQFCNDSVAGGVQFLASQDDNETSMETAESVFKVPHKRNLPV